MALNLEHQTAAQFVARLRQRYRGLRRQDLARLAAWLYNRYVAGDITETQIRNAFGLTTDTQWNNFRDKVLALRNAWIEIKDAEGE